MRERELKYFRMVNCRGSGGGTRHSKALKSLMGGSGLQVKIVSVQGKLHISFICQLTINNVKLPAGPKIYGALATLNSNRKKFYLPFKILC